MQAQVHEYLDKSIVLCEKLLKERDEALAKAEAYREVALKHSIFYSNEKMYEAATPEKVDAEAARILEQRKGEKP